MKDKRPNSRISVRNMLTISITGLIILIGVSVYGIYIQRQTRQTADSLVHTQTVITKLQYLEAQIYQVLNAQRGHIITGQKRYEEMYENNYKELIESLGALQKSTKDNEFQQAQIENLKNDIVDLRIYYGTTFDLITAGQRKRAVELVTSGRGQNLIDKIKGKIQKMIEHEEILLIKRSNKNERTRDLSSSLIVASSTLAILFIILALIKMYQEFTRRHKIQQELSLASQMQEAVLKATPIALVTTSSIGKVTLFNPAAEKLLGYTAQEVMGKNPGLWHESEEIAQMADKLSRRFNTRIGVNECMGYLAERNIIESETWTMIKKDGSRIKASLTLSPLKDEQDEVYGFIGMFYDITKQLEYEETIIQAREQALAGTKAKSEFLANMSHEIRTPMNAIMGMAELLMEADLNDEQRKYVEIFQRAGDSLLNIINDILDLSKIEAGHFELDRAPFRLTQVVQKAVEIIALKAHQKELELAVDLDENLSDAFIGDPNRIRQILLNLLGNSVKFTKKGEIILKIKGKTLSDNRQLITVEVQDTGIGMSEANLKKLFERFAQADSSITKEFGGTGLGLSITKRLTELMSGDIQVQSTQGVGSKFTATFIIEVDESPSEEIQTINLRGTKALVVDDTRTNRLIVRKILEHLGASVYEAEDGPRALAMIHEHKAQDAAFQMILLDSRMPGMDGFSVAEKVQSSDELKGPLMMMLTSDNRPGDLLRSRQLGLTSYMVKPILKVDLISAILRAMNNQPTFTSQKSTDQLKTGTDKLRILLVDDNDENRLVIRSFLKSQPWKIDEAKNGLEAIEEFKKQNYDLILMDMQMPVMDGYTATREIRRIEKESSTTPMPILALTAFALKEEFIKSYEAGCNGHLTKPVSKNSLLEAIRTNTAVIEVIANPDLAELIPDYLKGRSQELLKLEAALLIDDYTSVQALGHKLRGSAGSYGFDQLSEVGKELEENAKVKNRPLIEKALLEYQHYLKKVKVIYK